MQSETTINIKETPTAPSNVDVDPVGLATIEHVAEGIQPVADFLPKQVPSHSHPTPPPDPPLVATDDIVDTDMLYADSDAHAGSADAIPEVAQVADSGPTPISSEPSLVRPREDDGEEDDGRAAKRSRVEEESFLQPGPASDLQIKPESNLDDVPEPARADGSAPDGVDPNLKREHSPAPLPAEPATQPASLPTTGDSLPAPSTEDAEPTAKAQTSQPTPSALPAGAADAPRYSRVPITSAQRIFLIEKMKNLRKTKNSPDFNSAVDLTLYPHYTNFVANPMDLGTMDQKLKSGQYSSVQAYADDFELMVDNSRAFSGDAHSVTQKGYALRAYFRKAMEGVPSADEPAPQPKAPVKRSPSVSKAPSRRESRIVPAASPPRPSETFALNADGLPLLRRESTINRPARAIKPVKNRDPTYAKPQRKEHQLELKFCQHVLDRVRGPEYSAFNHLFLAPVDPVAMNIPHYRQIVKYPMDLGTMAQKLKQGQYVKASEFKKDFDLVVSNCLAFNPHGNAVRDMGINLGRAFETHWNQKAKWEHANKPESSTRVTSASADEESEEEDDDEDGDAPDDGQQLKIAALQKQLALLQGQITQITGLTGGTKPAKPRDHKKKSKHSNGTGKKVGSVSSAPKSKTLALPKSHKKGGSRPKTVTYEEKQEISEAVGQMSDAQVQRLTTIITENCQKYRDMDEMELEIDDLPNDVQALLLKYVRGIFGNPHRAAAAERVESPEDAGAMDDDDFEPERGQRGSVGGGSKRKKHKPMGKKEQAEKIKRLQSQLGQFPGGESESPDNSSFNAGGAAAEASSGDDSEESEED